MLSWLQIDCKNLGNTEKIVFCFVRFHFSEHEKLRCTQPAKADKKQPPFQVAKIITQTTPQTHPFQSFPSQEADPHRRVIPFHFLR